MKLEDGEYTTAGFVDYLKEKFGNKINGKEFNSNDVAQYLKRGYTPHRYGNLKITAETQSGIRIIKITKDEDSKTA